MVGGIRDGNIIGRSRELRMLLGMVDAVVQGRGSSIVIAGPAGVGKTSLLRATTAHAQHISAGGQKNMAVAAVMVAEAERAWPYAGLHLVLSGIAGALTPEDPVTAELPADELLNALGSEVRSYDVAMHLLSLISRTRGPVLIAIDNAHFMDSHSQEVVGFLARRLRPLPVGIFLAGDITVRPAPVLDGLPMLRLGELEHQDAVELLRSRHSDLVGSVADEISRRVGGNPRALLDVAGRLPPEHRRGHIALDRYLPASPVLQDLLLPELEQLSDGQRFALLVATVDAGKKTGPVLAALADQDPDVVEWLLQKHVDVTDGSYRLKTSAVGSIIWRASTLMERVQAHRLLAAAYDGLDAGEALWHRARSLIEPDDHVGAELERSAKEMLGRGELMRSVAFARESVRLSSMPEQRVQRLLLAGELAVFAGQCDEAVQVARERVRMDMSSEHGAELALLEARARLIGDGQVPTELVDREAARFAKTNPDRAAQFWLVAAAGFADQVELGDAQHYLARVESVRAELSEATLGSYRRIAAWVTSLLGNHRGAAELLGADSRAADVFTDADRCTRHAMVLTRLERYDEARRLLRVITDQRRFGDSPVLVGYAHSVRTVTEIRAGRLAAAKEAADAWQRAFGTGRVHRGSVPIYMIRAHVLMGDVAAAFSSHAQAQELAQHAGGWWATALLQAETGAMYLQLNQLDEAMSALERARDYALVYEDPSMLLAEPDFIEVCVRRGHLDRARTALATYEVRVVRVPTFWARHTLARCRALVAEGDESLKLFDNAMQTFAHQVSPVELARTQLCYGERMRRMGRRAEATEWLQRAIVWAGECGAGGLAARAEDELGFGGRSASSDASPHRKLAQLTEAELRVARLTAAGKRNREIAAELYVSVRTVEAHLGRIYRKLGVRSRAELTGVVAAAEPSAEGPGLS